LEVLVHRASNFNLEWGFLAPAPSFLRALRLVVVATAIGATTSAAAVFALMRQPAAEESIATRTMVRSVGQAPPTGRGPAAAQTQIQTEQAVRPGKSPARESADAPVHPRAAATGTPTEAPSIIAEAPAGREASEISASPAKEAAPSLKPPSKKPRLTSLDERRVVATRYANRPASPSAGNTAHNSVIRHNDSNVVHHDESVVGRTIRVTGDIVAATQRAIFAVAMIP
jgi:hypothetical protein